MGAFGTGLADNDTFLDVYDEFFQFYNDGVAVPEISTKLFNHFESYINDPDDSNNFWFALALAQWECKQLDSMVIDKVKEIIKSGSDIQLWKQLGADEADIKKRKVILDKFLNSIQKERKRAKATKKKKIYPPVYEKGDCLTFKLANGNYGGAIVLEKVSGEPWGHNLIATTRINSSKKPTLIDFENAEILINTFAKWDNKPNIFWYIPTRHKQVADLIEKVANISIGITYNFQEYQHYGLNGEFLSFYINTFNNQLEFEKTNPKSDKRLMVKNLI